MKYVVMRTKSFTTDVNSEKTMVIIALIKIQKSCYCGAKKPP